MNESMKQAGLCPLISVVIPLYNGGDRITKALKELDCQSFQEAYEVIVVDDHSTDDSLTVVENAVKGLNHPEYFRVIYCETNGRAGRARNIGVREAKGEYILFVDQDDYPDRELLQVLYSLKNWSRTNDGISSETGSFRVVYCDIEIEGREVRKWQQPLLEAMGQSTFGLIYCIEDGIMKFMVRSKSEVGCFDKIEIGPSVQLEPNDNPFSNAVDLLFLDRLRHNQGIEFSGLFSEEGGRFYRSRTAM